MYFSKKVWGKSPEAGEFSRIFVSKVTLQPVTLHLTESYGKKLGQQDVLVASQIILYGEQLLPCSPGSGAYE